jgi:uncharacterized protein (TIGR00296 family)
MYNIDQGTELVKLARETVSEFFNKRKLELRKTDIKAFNEKHGVFVTIKNHEDNSLRGCIGHIAPMNLYESLQQVSISAAFYDPRFSQLQESELDKVVFEISIMSEPVLVEGKNPTEWKKNIKIGRDGLIISNGSYSGLLLPQVPVEEKWDIDEYLKNVCIKAGMTEDFLSDENTQLWSFTCQAFQEKEPSGEIISI